MIKHIVMWKLKDFDSEKEKLESMLRIKTELEALKNMIDGIIKIEVGINICDSEQSYDICLYSEFENMNALNLYQKHPEHIKVGEFIGRVRDKRIVVDYEI